MKMTSERNGSARDFVGGVLHVDRYSIAMPAAVEIAVRGTAIVYALVEGASVTVGRVAQCEIHIDDQSVSRRHCTLALRGATLVVTDLESANGTFLNERP